MLERLIEFSLKRRSAVLLLALAIAAAGAASLRELDVDAFPDTTPVQVQVNASVPALGPEEVERQITSPIEQALAGLPKLTALRSISKFGLSQTTLTFADGTDLYFARQVVGERLQSVALPEGVDRPRLGPVSTGLGEVFHYLVRGRGADPTELRTIHDWTIRPALRTVPGVAEVNSWGGFEKQYQIVVDPQKLLRHGLTLASVIEATERNNRNVGGGSISQATGMLLVQGQGRPDSIARIKEAAIATKDGVPVRLGDVADVVIGHEIRRGAVTAQGEGEVVLGLGFMLVGENSKVVAGALRDKLREVQQTLPRNVETVVAYDRTELVDVVLDTVRANLFEGGLLVIAVLFAFLGRLRAAFLVALAIPLSMLFAFSGMLRFGVAASLLSLGAIDFGMIVDSSVVMVENCVRRLAEPGAADRPRRDVVRDAAMEVRRPTLFGELIVAIVYLPILTLEGIEGKLFRPMALTVVFALLGSMIFSVTLAPTLASWMLPRGAGPHREPWPMRLAHRLHEPILRFAMRRKAAVAALALAMLVFAFGIVAPSLGTEFVPRLSEGSIVVNVVRLAGADLAESIAANTRMERALLAEFPDEVERVWSRIGTAEIATDPMGVELTDLFVSLKPRSRWTRARTQAELTVAFEKTLRQFPGQKLSFSQPIELRLAEMTSGIRSEFGVKLFGDDFDVLVKKANEIAAALGGIAGAADVAVEQVTGQPVLQITPDLAQLGKYGLTVDEALDYVQAIAGRPVGDVIEGQLRFPLAVRLPESHRASPSALAQLPVVAAGGEQIPLGRLAKIETIESPSTITREWGRRRIAITCNIRDRDLGSFVAEARAEIGAEISLPDERYRIEYGGQYEHLERAKARLWIVTPIALALVLALLYITYGGWLDSLRVFSAVPFAWVGGIIALWLRDMPFSVPAAVGFIAMSGLAVLDDMILVSTIRRLRAGGLGVDEAVATAARQRLRPVLMTTLVASLGFLPMAASTGVGAEVQRPLATVVIGGAAAAMITSLLVVRVLYMLSERLRFKSRGPEVGAANPSGGASHEV